MNDCNNCVYGSGPVTSDHCPHCEFNMTNGTFSNWTPIKVVKKMVLSADAKERKGTPITTGVLDYFPLAIAAVAQCSKAGNDQHNKGQPLHWAKEKSTDHADCIARHLIDRGSFDTDGIRHSAKLAWRALAALQTELENE
jgi:hypothetical protein